MAQLKIIFTGASSQLALQAIATIGDVPVVTEEAALRSTASLSLRKRVLSLRNQEQVQLYAVNQPTSGAALRALLAEGGMGVVVLLDNCAGNGLAELNFYRDQCRPMLENSKLVFGVVGMETQVQPTLLDYYMELRGIEPKPVIFEVDISQRADISLLIEALLYSLDPGAS
jgi:hypothetical protein